MIKRLDLLRGVVHPWHHDHFGHMNVRHYAPFSTMRHITCGRSLGYRIRR
jgi:acyl-CoA thioester hydrolase